MAKSVVTPAALPSDNAARIALYDELYAARSEGLLELDAAKLMARVLPRLAILVPRELHIYGPEIYFASKLAACVDAGIIERREESNLIAVAANPPDMAFPDGSVRPYSAGLEAAKERIQADDEALRRSGFHIHRLVRSVADDRTSHEFQNLVESIQERGYLDTAPILVSGSGLVVDGRARKAAAEQAGIGSAKTAPIPIRRDTPLHHALLVLDANSTRLTPEERQSVHAAIAAKTGREWSNIARDLGITREWRLTNPREYAAQFDVKKMRYRTDGEANVQVTKDRRKVMLRSLLEAVGLASYKYNYLNGYVFMEEARTRFTGKKAIFVGVNDAIAGIDAMRRERRKRGLKVEPEWKDMRDWLQTVARGTSEGRSAEPGRETEPVEATV